MKRYLIIFMFLFLALTYSQAKNDRSKNDDNKFSKNHAFFTFFEDLKGSEVTVAIKDLDVTISGVLIEVYKDGLIIKSFTKQVYYIPKYSIAYAKARQKDQEDNDEYEQEESEDSIEETENLSLK